MSKIVKFERIKSEAVAAITGYSIRQVQEMAALGKIPSAAKPGVEWTFNERAVRRWMRLKEQEIECRQTSTSAKVSGTRALRSTVRTNDKAYEQVLNLRRLSNSARGPAPVESSRG
jgi:phage terminase Nu1 subunit (DNA packaging protein)